jgi:hypothetical protein
MTTKLAILQRKTVKLYEGHGHARLDPAEAVGRGTEFFAQSESPESFNYVEPSATVRRP